MSALVWCPFPDRKSAIAVADGLLEEGVIACANIMGEMHSRYIWQGEKGASEEIGVLFKAHSDSLEKAIERIESLHPYKTPAILGWHCDSAGAATQVWLGALLRQEGLNEQGE